MPTMTVSGPSLVQELVYANSLLGRSIDNQAPSAALTTLLSGTGWAKHGVDVGLSNVSARFDGVPIWSCILKLANILGVHVREVSGRQLDFGAFGTASGIILLAPGAASPMLDNNPNVAIIQSIKVTEEGSAIINRVVPGGAGEGATLFQLGDPKTGAIWSSRTTPYTIQHAIGPNGLTYFYLQDAASIAAYGAREKLLADKQMAPIANSVAAYENAANALYDEATAYLLRFKDALKVYDIGVSKLADNFSVGDTLHITFRGVAFDENGVLTGPWLDVDDDLVVMEKTRNFDANGGETWALTVATVARYLQNDQEILLGALETLQAFRTSIKLSSFETNHGSVRESIVSGSDLYYTVEYRNNVSQLLEATLYCQLKGLKSNVTTGAAGGSHTHTVSVASHTHSISGSTSGSPSGTFIVASWTHIHAMFTRGAAASAGNPYFYTDSKGKSFIAQAWDSGEFDSYGASGDTAYVPTSSHTHSISGSTSGSGGGQDVTSAASTTHTHSLVYGIYQASLPGTPAVRVLVNSVDRTVALGGPWNVDFDADISPYLQDASGFPLRQKNVVRIQTPNATAFDVIVSVRSFLSASALEAS